MILKNLLILSILVSLFFETTIIPFPLVFIISALAYILYPELIIVIVSFVAAFILDVIKLSPVGLTPMVIILTFGVVEIFKRAYETRDPKFILLFLIVGSFIFAKFFSYNPNLFIYIALFGATGVIGFYLSKKLSW